MIRKNSRCELYKWREHPIKDEKNKYMKWYRKWCIVWETKIYFTTWSIQAKLSQIATIICILLMGYLYFYYSIMDVTISNYLKKQYFSTTIIRIMLLLRITKTVFSCTHEHRKTQMTREQSRFLSPVDLQLSSLKVCIW